MIVCHCLAITDRDLKKAASSSAGLAGPEPSRRAGSCCGGCRPLVQKLLQSYGTKQSEGPAAQPSE
jgi:bacterioferritin-associated ferredoxin